MSEEEVFTETKPCSRCGLHVRADRINPECDDCKSLYQFVPVNNHTRALPIRYSRTDFDRIEPGYEIALHYNKQVELCPTRHAMNSAGLPYSVYKAGPDPFEVAYAMGLHEGDGPIEYPIVLITRHGEYLEHWEGFRLADLNRIPTDRDRILGRPDTDPGVPTELKEAA